MSRDKVDESTAVYIAKRIKRVLAFKALRKIGHIVDEIEHEEKRSKRATFLAVIFLLFVAAFIYSAINKHQLANSVIFNTSTDTQVNDLQ
jgi:cbb3-type cytochrome oxidase subunit 3